MDKKVKDSIIKILVEEGIRIDDPSELEVVHFNSWHIDNVHTMNSKSYNSFFLYDIDQQPIGLINQDDKQALINKEPFKNGISYFKFLRELAKADFVQDLNIVHIVCHSAEFSTFGLFDKNGVVKHYFDKGWVSGDLKDTLKQYAWELGDKQTPKYEQRTPFDNREGIEAWLKAHPKIAKYTINDDLSVDVDGSVSLSLLSYIPFQFNRVSGNFKIEHSSLRNLEGCPREVGGTFYMWAQDLMSLKGGPQKVGGDYDIIGNRLPNFEYCASYVGKNFKAQDNHAVTLDYLPKFVGGDLELQHVRLKQINLESFTGVDFKGEIKISSAYGNKFAGLEKLYRDDELILNKSQIDKVILEQKLECELENKPNTRKKKI